MRILTVDAEPAMHDSYRGCFAAGRGQAGGALGAMAAELFGDADADVPVPANGTIEGQVEIAIRDDGEGFDPENAFQRVFCLRAHKSGGLGLHWCANSMLAMGGTLELLSEGTRRGARVLLTLSTALIELPGELAA